MKHLEFNTLRTKASFKIPGSLNISQEKAHQGWSVKDEVCDRHHRIPGYVRFTRKNEHYSRDQLSSLTLASRLDSDEIGKQVFCGTKIQIGIGVVTNFLQMGLQYRKPIKGRAEFINGTWHGIVSGLTMDPNKPSSYDMAFGNFLAYDEEFPYMKFGPFYAIESKLVLLTGSSRRVESSAFGTNINPQLWVLIFILILVLSFLATFLVQWQQTQHILLDREIKALLREHNLSQDELETIEVGETEDESRPSTMNLMQNFFFIYFAMILNKPCVEFDNLIWPKRSARLRQHLNRIRHLIGDHEDFKFAIEQNNLLLKHFRQLLNERKRSIIPITIRMLSYIWSGACFVMGSIYSGEMLAVILLHTDQNIDTISQLINSKPHIEPVIRQDDFTYNLMLKSLDKNMLKLHNITKIIERPEVYKRSFIESVSERKRALLGDDELIETIYDIYSQHFPLYRSKTTYLQYPISIMYRKDLNVSLEKELRRGLVQLFEMGLLQRWNQAQKETYIRFYEGENKQAKDKGSKQVYDSVVEQKYKPLSVNHFKSFFKLMLFCIVFATFVLIIEVFYFHIYQRLI